MSPLQDVCVRDIDWTTVGECSLQWHTQLQYLSNDKSSEILILTVHIFYSLQIACICNASEFPA